MKVKDPGAIARARRREGYSQRDLAALVRCTQATISAMETGRMRGCSKDLAEAIARRLNRDVEDLFAAHPGTRVRRVTNAAGSTRQTGRAA